MFIYIFKITHIYIIFRLTELILNNEMNLPFCLRICQNELTIDKLDNHPHRYYHLEELNYDENENNKDIALIPVAHYIKVRISNKKKKKCIHINKIFYLNFLIIFSYIILLKGKFNTNQSTKIFSILYQDTLLERSYFIDCSQERNLQPIFFLILKLVHILFDD